MLVMYGICNPYSKDNTSHYVRAFELERTARLVSIQRAPIFRAVRNVLPIKIRNAYTLIMLRIIFAYTFTLNSRVMRTDAPRETTGRYIMFGIRSGACIQVLQ